MKATSHENHSPAIKPLDPHSVLYEILHNATYAAFLLMAATVGAMTFANVGALQGWYHDLVHMDIAFNVGSWGMAHSLHHWVNDGLMALFFFLVGLEIKRELLIGELASFRKAALPLGAAVGGMACPAMVYAYFNYGGTGSAGWGIPMATDIAFAVGVLGLLSKRVPSSLTIFLLALAIVDDLGAVTVIALFYTSEISFVHLGAGFGLLAFSLAIAWWGVRAPLVYLHLFPLVWYTFHESGVHATIAGVLFAFTIPSRAMYDAAFFEERIAQLARQFKEADDPALPFHQTPEQQHIMHALEVESERAEPLLQRLERLLHPLSAFLILPIFAFVNAGVPVHLESLGLLLKSPVVWGIAAGLILGKVVGITGFSYVMVRMGWADRPDGVSWLQIVGVSLLGAIGFTMSLFITQLAFFDPEIIEEAKLAVLAASTIAGILGASLLFASGGKNEAHHLEGKNVHA